MEPKFLLYPQFRIRIKASLACLADKDLQMKEWIDPNYLHPYWDSLLYYVYDTLYNDFDLNEYKERNIGEVFYDEEEAKQIQKFCKWFFDLIDVTIEYEKPNSHYINHPEWPKVYIGAREIWELMDRNEKKYNFNELENS